MITLRFFLAITLMLKEESMLTILLISFVLLKLYKSKKNALVLLLIIEVIIIIAILLIVSRHFSIVSLSLALTVFTISVGEARLALAILINIMRKTQSSYLHLFPKRL